MEVADVLGYGRPGVEKDLNHPIDAVKAEMDDRKYVEPGSRKPFFTDKAALPQSRHIVVEMVDDYVIGFRGGSWLLEILRGGSDAACLLTMDSAESASASKTN